MSAVPSAEIVVIDDHPEHLDYLATLLRRCGYAVDAFRSAQAALRRVEQSAPGLVITDVFMPGMDGFEVLRGLRHAQPELPIIAVSGKGPQDRAIFLKAMQQLGACAGFAKPIDMAALLDAVARVTGAAPSHRRSNGRST
jgi:CheY-like chemotaxis protein